VEDYLTDDPADPDGLYAAEAAVLEGWELDRVRYRVAGPTFRAADLAHWLALDVAAQALADAGFPEAEGLPRDATGVLLGNSLTGEFSRASLMRLRWPYVERTVGAALREAEEEIALPRTAVTVVGAADRYRTITNFEVTPVIGVVPPDLQLTPSEAEVASVFEVPLDFLLDSANQRQQVAQYQGRERRYYEILWQDRRIWGATAAMLVNLSRRLRWAA